MIKKKYIVDQWLLTEVLQPKVGLWRFALITEEKIIVNTKRNWITVLWVLEKELI